MNPYAHHLGDRDPLQVISATPSHLSHLLDKIRPEAVNQQPAPGKWSVRDILCHLADTEIAFAFRLRQAVAEPHHVIQPFDQDKWAAPYSKLTAGDAIAAFSGVRQWNLKLIENLAPGIHSKPVTHPERGEMTFQVLIETMAGHDLNHVQQIEARAS